MKRWIISPKILFFLPIIFIYCSGIYAQGTSNWRKINTGTEIDFNAIEWPTENGGFVVGKDGKLYYTSDGGETWYEPPGVATQEDLNDIGFQKSQNGFSGKGTIVGNKGTILSTTDFGNTWQSVNSGTTNNLNSVFYGYNSTTHESYAYAVGDNSTVLVNYYSDNNWYPQSTPYHYDHFYGTYFYNNAIGWIVGSTGIMYNTKNSGGVWDYIAVTEANPNLYGIYFTSLTKGYTCGAGGKILSTTNGGSSWNEENSGTQENLLDINVPDDQDTAATVITIVGHNGTLLTDENKDRTWEKTDLGTTYTLRDISSDTQGYLWIAGDHGTIYTNRPQAAKPAAPSSLTSEAKSSSEIKLTFQDNSNNETGFIIEIFRTSTGGSPDDTDTVNTVQTDRIRIGGKKYFNTESVNGIIEYIKTGLNPNTEYVFRVCAYNSVGKSAYSNETRAATFDTVPIAPTNLAAAVISSSQINLGWTDNSSNELGFILERKTGSTGTWTDRDTLAANVVEFHDTYLSPNTQYYYRITAYNSGGESAYSNETTATTLDTTPNAPTGLTASSISSSEINLTWNDNSTNELGFIIEKKSGSSVSWTNYDTVSTNITKYQDNGLLSNTEYYYRIYSYNSVGRSSYSNEVNATTSDILPIKPSELTATALSNSQMNLSWKDNSNNETGFKLERKIGLSDFIDLTTTDKNITTYLDNNLTDGTHHTYRICASNSIGNSDYSNESFDITPLSAPTDFSAKITSTGLVLLEWKDNSQSETGFTIEKKAGNASYTKLTDVSANTLSYTDGQVMDGNQYYYKVFAFNNIVSSEYTDEVSITIVDVLSETIPTEFSLHQNYPNPFNPSTNIKFGIPKNGRYTINIYNIIGQKIAVLADKDFSPGFYTVNFDASSFA